MQFAPGDKCLRGTRHPCSWRGSMTVAEREHNPVADVRLLLLLGRANARVNGDRCARALPMHRAGLRRACRANWLPARAAIQRRKFKRLSDNPSRLQSRIVSVCWCCPLVIEYNMHSGGAVGVGNDAHLSLSHGVGRLGVLYSPRNRVGCDVPARPTLEDRLQGANLGRGQFGPHFVTQRGRSTRSGLSGLCIFLQQVAVEMYFVHVQLLEGRVRWFRRC